MLHEDFDFPQSRVKSGIDSVSTDVDLGLLHTGDTLAYILYTHRGGDNSRLRARIRCFSRRPLRRGCRRWQSERHSRARGRTRTEHVGAHTARDHRAPGVAQARAPSARLDCLVLNSFYRVRFESERVIPGAMRSWGPLALLDARGCMWLKERPGIWRPAQRGKFAAR
jgi:hypothetical protein